MPPRKNKIPPLEVAHAIFKSLLKSNSNEKGSIYPIVVNEKDFSRERRRRHHHRAITRDAQITAEGTSDDI